MIVDWRRQDDGPVFFFLQAKRCWLETFFQWLVTIARSGLRGLLYCARVRTGDNVLTTNGSCVVEQIEQAAPPFRNIYVSHTHDLSFSFHILLLTSRLKLGTGSLVIVCRFRLLSGQTCGCLAPSTNFGLTFV